MKRALASHWPEYLTEAAGLGLFMVSACGWGAFLEYPGSPARAAVTDPDVRRLLMGLLMGLTAIGLIHSPWGKRSGAHLNPSVTLTFLRLGKVAPWDAVFYIVAQFTGGLLGAAVAAVFFGRALAHPAVNYVVTTPGAGGASIAFLAEAAISFGLMVTVLIVSNTEKLARFTGVCAGALVAFYIALEAPLSGMSMNPARTLGSALPANTWTALWLYFTAPLLGMLLAAEAYLRIRGVQNVLCAKLHHHNSARCIFRCGYPDRMPRPFAEAAGTAPEENRLSHRPHFWSRRDRKDEPARVPVSHSRGG
jgi:aquaporin Z